MTQTERIKLSLATLREIEQTVVRDDPKLEDSILEQRIANVVRLYCATLSTYGTELEPYSE